MPRHPKSHRPPTRNPLHSWLESRKADQKRLEEITTHVTTASAQDMTWKLIDELNSVDFIHSRLPERTLNDLVEGFPFCKLEYDTRALIQMLRQDRQNINMDIRGIDKKLMTLAMMFQQFVAHGDNMAAKMACDALQIGIMDIRCKLPVYQPELVEAFVKANEGYLDQWITLVGVAQTYDYLQSYLEAERAVTQYAEEECQARMDAIGKRFKQDPEFAKAFDSIRNKERSTNRTTWSEIDWEIHRLMIDSYLEDFNLKLHQQMCSILENALCDIKQKMDSFRICLNRLPIVSDPNLMNQYWETTEQFVRGVANFDRIMYEVFADMEVISDGLVDRDRVQEQMMIPEQRLSALLRYMDQLPNVTDPDLFEQYKEDAQRWRKEIEASDAYVEGVLEAADAIRDRLNQSDDKKDFILRWIDDDLIDANRAAYQKEIMEYSPAELAGMLFGKEKMDELSRRKASKDD